MTKSQQKSFAALRDKALRDARAEISRTQDAISLRSQMLWAIAMQQAGYTAKDIETVRSYLPAVTEKYDSMKADGIADGWLAHTLAEDNIYFAQIPNTATFDDDI